MAFYRWCPALLCRTTCQINWLTASTNNRVGENGKQGVASHIRTEASYQSRLLINFRHPFLALP
jgi:hypothetical protein